MYTKWKAFNQTREGDIKIKSSKADLKIKETVRQVLKDIELQKIETEFKKQQIRKTGIKEKRY